MDDRKQSREPGKADAQLGRRTSSSWLGRHVPALVAAGVGLLLSLIGAYAVGRWEARIARAEFEGAAATELIVLQNGINEYLSRLVALRTLFESANEEVTRSEFEVFSGRLFENHPGILRVGWLPKIYGKERADYEAAAANDGVVGYRIKTFSSEGEVLGTAPPSNQYFPIYFSTEPKTSMVYGLDYSTEPMRWNTLQRARDNDSIAAVPTKLVYDTARRYSWGARQRAGLCQGNVARHDRRPPPQSERLCRRHIRSGATVAIDPQRDGCVFRASSSTPLPARLRPKLRGGNTAPFPIIHPRRQRRNWQKPLRRGRAGRVCSGLATPTGRSGRFPRSAAG